MSARAAALFIALAAVVALPVQPLLAASYLSYPFPPRIKFPDVHFAKPDRGLQGVSAQQQDALNVELAGQTKGGTVQDVAVQGDYAYVGVGSHLMVLNVRVPGQAAVVGESAAVREPILKLAVAGNYAYVLVVGGMHVFDITDTARPVAVGAVSIAGNLTSIAVAGHYVYVGQGGSPASGVQIINVAGPLDPRVVGSHQTTGGVVDIALAGDYAYLAVGLSGRFTPPQGELLVLDIRNPANPTKAGSTALGYATGVAVAGNHAYVVANTPSTPDAPSGLARPDLLHVFDVSAPNRLTERGSLSLPDSNGEIAIMGNYTYIATGTGLQIVDVADPPNLTIAGAYPTQGSIARVVVEQSTAYAVESRAHGTDGGLHLLNLFDPRNPVKAGVSLYRPMYNVLGVALRHPYAYVVAQSGFYVMDITDPARPIQVGFAPVGGQSLALSGNHAYLAAGSHGVRVLDIHDPRQPLEVGAFPTPEGAAMNITIRGTYAYVAAFTAGLRILDIADPARPREVGAIGKLSQFPPPLGQWPAREVGLFGNYAYVPAQGARLRIVDVTDPTRPSDVSGLPGHFATVTIAGNHAYIGGDISGGDDDLRILNLANPVSPVAVGSIATSGVWDTAVSGSLAYVVAADLRLHVVDVSNPASPAEVGTYDSRPESDTTNVREGSSVVEAAGDLAYIARGPDLAVFRFTLAPVQTEQVRALYREVLCREGDPGGVQSWSGSGLSVGHVRQGLLTSGEGQRVQAIRGYFQRLLERDPLGVDCVGLRGWVDSGLLLHEIEGIVATSEERLAAIRLFYREELAQEADAAGLEGWARSGLPLPEVQLALRGSPEGQRVAGVRFLYLDLLGRDPIWDDTAALRGWVDSGLSLEAIRQAIMQSEEYRQRGNPSSS